MIPSLCLPRFELLNASVLECVQLCDLVTYFRRHARPGEHRRVELPSRFKSPGRCHESKRWGNGEHLRKLDRYFDKETNFEGGTLNVCRKDNVGSRSDRWFHDVYLAILLFLIHRDPLRKDYLLSEAIKDE